MRLHTLFLAFGITGLALTACENELVQDAEMNVGVETTDGVTFDGQTITVKAGTPVNFRISGEPDYLTFFSGEAGNEYRYKDRTEVDTEDIESSVLTFKLQAQYGSPANILQILISPSFAGIKGNDFESDSVLVETSEWEALVEQSKLPTAVTKTDAEYSVDMSKYLGQRVAIAIVYKGVTNDAVQSKFYFKNMKITNTMTNGQTTALTASSFGFTPINMYYRHADVIKQSSAIKGKPYGTVTNNTSGMWNLAGLPAQFYIHSTPKNGPLMYSWLVSNLMVVNGCTPDSGTGVKNITQGTDTYCYTYENAGTYTATFVGTNANYKKQTSVTNEYKVVVTE